MNELETIVATLGVERSANLFHSIVPLLNIRRHELLECLNKQDYAGAAHYAHNLLATGHLLASKTLLDQLMLIERCDPTLIQPPDFIQKLDAELAASLQRLTQYSKSMRPNL